MSIASTVTRVQYAITSASAAPLSVPFRFDEESWLIVYYVGTGSQEAVILTNGSGYVVTGDGVTIEGYVTLNGAFLASIDSGVLTISRKTPALQNLNLQYSQRLPAELLELELDRLTMAVQDRDLSPNSVGSRAVVFPLTEPPSNSNVLDIPENRANKFWSGDAAGKMVFRNAQEVANLILGYLGGPPSTADYLAAISAIQPIRLISPPTSATNGQGGQIAFIPYVPEGIRILGMDTVASSPGIYPPDITLFLQSGGSDPQTKIYAASAENPAQMYDSYFDSIDSNFWKINAVYGATASIFDGTGDVTTPASATWPPNITVELLADQPGRIWINTARTGEVPVWVEITEPSLPTIPDILAILLYGQSNSTGADAIPVITVSPVGAHRTFSGGVRSSGFGETFGDLFETQDSNLGETPCSGLAEGWNAAGENPPNLFLSTAGQGGLSITDLEKGSTRYNFLISQAQRAFDLSIEGGLSFGFSGLYWIQGESDAGSMDRATYLSKLFSLRNDIEDDFRLIDGGSETLQMPLIQASAHILEGDGVALAQLDGVLQSPSIHLACPAYCLPHINNIHYSAIGSLMAGHYAGRVFRHLNEETTAPPALLPIQAVSYGRKITVSYKVPSPPLTINNSHLVSTINYGFRVVDSIGEVPISSIDALISSVQIVTARDISGPATVRYALDYNSTIINNGASGNLMDSTDDVILYQGDEVLLPHVAPHSSLDIQVMDDIPSSPSPPPSPIEATAHWKFGGSSACLTDANGNVLALTASLAPTYNASSIVLPTTTFLQGLITDFDDSMNFTLLLVFKRAANIGTGNFHPLLGTMNPFTGTGLVIGGTVPDDDVRLNTPGPGPIPYSVAMNGGAIGAPICVVLRRTPTNLGVIFSGDSLPLYTNIANTVPATANKLAIGNAYANVDFARVPREYYEAVYWPVGLSVPRCYEELTRSRMRMAQKGIFF